MKLIANPVHLSIVFSFFLFTTFANALTIDPDFDGVAAFDFIPLGWSDTNFDGNPDIGEFSQLYGLGFGFGSDFSFSDGDLITFLDLDLSLLIVGPYFQSMVLPNDFDINDSAQFIGDTSSIIDNRSSAVVPVPAAGLLFFVSGLTLALVKKAKKIRRAAYSIPRLIKVV